MGKVGEWELGQVQGNKGNWQVKAGEGKVHNVINNVCGKGCGGGKPGNNAGKGKCQ